jgi:hypothetical protein
MSAYGQDPYQIYPQTQTETRTVVVDVPLSELGEYMQRRIDQLERERDYYRNTAHGFKGSSMLLQQALKRLNPKAPELSREFLERAGLQAIQDKLADDISSTLISTSPTLAEMGLDAKGRPLNPGEAPAAGGLIGGLKKLFG